MTPWTWLRTALIATALAPSAHDVAPADADTCCAVIELRQYTLHPGRRDTLIELFEREFVESQEAEGIRLIGLFRDVDAPDRFVWLRGFADMAQRAQALGAFYGGPVWKAHREAANATMIDSDDVLLLRPVGAGAGFGYARGALPPHGAPLRESRVEARLLYADGEAEPEAIDAAVAALAGPLRNSGGRLLAVLRSEHAANSFPRLPVREGEHVVALFAAFADADAQARFAADLERTPEWKAAVAGLARGAPRATQVLRLAPTSRSRLPRFGDAASARTERAP